MVTVADVGDVDPVTGGDSEVVPGAVILTATGTACHHTVHLVVTENGGQHRAHVTTGGPRRAARGLTATRKRFRITTDYLYKSEGMTEWTL